MEEICDKVCVFEESLEIDFDFEFDVEKFFDFSRTETIEEISESERWFHLSQGYPPSPLLLKLGLISEETEGNDIDSPRYEHQYDSSATSSDDGKSEDTSRDHWKKQGPGSKSQKPKPANQSHLSTKSRLLHPTKSQLAKQNQQISVRETRPPGSAQKPGISLKSPGSSITATKRHKLQNGYFRKTGSSNETACQARPKTSALKETSVAAANRAQQRRSQGASELGQGSKYDSCSSRSRLLNGKVLEPKKNTPSLASVLKGLKKSVSCSTKENKNPNSVAVKPTRCCLKQNQTNGRRVTAIAC